MHSSAPLTRTTFNQPTMHRHNSFWFIPLKLNLSGKCIVICWCDVGECVLQDESEGVDDCVGNPCTATDWKTGELHCFSVVTTDWQRSQATHTHIHIHQRWTAFILKPSPRLRSRLRRSSPQTPKNAPNHYAKHLRCVRECDNWREGNSDFEASTKIPVSFSLFHCHSD